MATGSFYEDGAKVLTPGAFEFVLDSELKRAVRSQNFLTLVTLEASREWEGMTMTADEGTLQEDVGELAPALECPWHGSRFCMRDGRVLTGPATVNAPRYDVRVRNDQVELKRIDDH